MLRNNALVFDIISNGFANAGGLFWNSDKGVMKL